VRNFSQRLREAISKSGVKAPKSALASHTGVSLPTVSRWLGGTLPKAETLESIAEFLNVDVKWLLTGNGSPERQESQSALAKSDPIPSSIAPEAVAVGGEESVARIATALERIAGALEVIAKSR
jgi:transcriptional regulator with XRE-family HTH domain